MAPQAPVPRVFLLPKNDAATPLTIVTLPHPRTSVPTRFLVHESTGLYEITKIVPSTGAPRSWLLTPDTPDPDPDTPDPDWLGTGHTIADAALYLATPYDPLFLLLPRLLPRVPAPTAALFRPLDDLLDALSEGEGEGEDGGEDGGHWAAVLRVQKCRDGFAARVKAVSEAAGGGTDAYRPVVGRAVEVLARKCEVMAGGLPASMKRRKEKEKEEQEERRRRPAVASRAVKDLGKVNTRGMAKMTSFFKKKEEA